MKLEIGGANYLLDVEKAKASGVLKLSIDGLNRPIQSGDVFVFGSGTLSYGVVTQFSDGLFGLLGMNVPFRHYLLRMKDGTTKDKVTENELIENLPGWRFVGNISNSTLGEIKKLK